MFSKPFWDHKCPNKLTNTIEQTSKNKILKMIQIKVKESNECTMFILKMQKNSFNPFIDEYKFHF